MVHKILHSSNLRHLPLAIRVIATSVISPNRKLDDLERLQEYSETAPAAQRILLLPIVFLSLDPGEIPDPGILDERELVVTIDDAISKALVAFEILYNIQLPKKADGLGADLWPRVIAWAQWIDTYSHYITNSPALVGQTFCLSFLGISDTIAQNSEIFQLVISEPWVWGIIGQAWTRLPSLTDARQRLATVRRLGRFFFHQNGLSAPQNFAELVDGLGGKLSELGQLTVYFFDEVVPAADQPIGMPYLRYLKSGFNLVLHADQALSDGIVTRAESCSEWRRSLYCHKIVRVLLRAICSLCITTFQHTLLLLRDCFKLINTTLLTSFGFTDLPAAIDDGLIRSLVACTLSPFAQDLQPQLEKYLVISFPPRLHDYGFLSSLVRALNGLVDVVTGDRFKSSEVRPIWDVFLALTHIPSTVLEILSDRIIARASSSPVLKACDNVECLKIKEEANFRRCSACRSCYYCSRACQISAWRQNHRLVCASYGRLILSERNSPPTTHRQRSFLRALVDYDYRKNKEHIFLRHAIAMHQGKQPITIYNYAKGEAQIRVKTTDTFTKLDGPEWDDLLLRARMSGGRMRIDIVETLDIMGVNYTVLPLRTDTAIVDAEFRRMVNEFQLTQDHFLAEKVELIKRIQSLASLTESPGFIEFH
ncbi:hypothetical protein R3P38DRAFT_3234024 [Favolaschia claudopus]|uniref:MYND-type domain-containing protein n=1 Tax=Favolaschia claudopus TaxID=2862362 RepID=A0AAV9ZHP1_9AGAR